MIAFALVGSTLVSVGAPGTARADFLPMPDIPGIPLPPLPPPLGPKPEEPKPKPRCTNASDPFIPRSVAIPGVDERIPVLALRRDREGVPGAPPTNRGGRFKMAFDLDSGIRPGHDRGNALLNAHTWPDGSALGNALLDELDEGDRITVRGNSGKICYRVTDRIEVRDGDRSAKRRYYSREGKPQIAIAVCSGRRLGPGNWTHRTLWFASPVR